MAVSEQIKKDNNYMSDEKRVSIGNSKKLTCNETDPEFGRQDVAVGDDTSSIAFLVQSYAPPPPQPGPGLRVNPQELSSSVKIYIRKQIQEQSAESIPRSLRSPALCSKWQAQ